MEQNRRKKVRLPLQRSIRIKQVGGSDWISVEVFDLSSRGIGFLSPAPCGVGVTYESSIVIWTGETIRAFFEIVRLHRVDGREETLYSCGGSFVGLSQTDENKLAIYETIEQIHPA